MDFYDKCTVSVASVELKKEKCLFYSVSYEACLTVVYRNTP